MSFDVENLRLKGDRSVEFVSRHFASRALIDKVNQVRFRRDFNVCSSIFSGLSRRGWRVDLFILHEADFKANFYLSDSNILSIFPFLFKVQSKFE